jgi:hypothetical protein
MLYLTQNTQILLAIKPVDFRKQIDGLIALCEQRFSENARSGQLFVFINKQGSMIRVLCYEGNGYWLATKRLSCGRYALWPKSTESMSCPVTSCELIKILKTCIASRVKKL